MTLYMCVFYWFMEYVPSPLSWLSLLFSRGHKKILRVTHFSKIVLRISQPLYLLYWAYPITVNTIPCLSARSIHEPLQTSYTNSTLSAVQRISVLSVVSMILFLAVLMCRLATTILEPTYCTSHTYIHCVCASHPVVPLARTSSLILRAAQSQSECSFRPSFSQHTSCPGIALSAAFPNAYLLTHTHTHVYMACRHAYDRYS